MKVRVWLTAVAALECVLVSTIVWAGTVTTIAGNGTPGDSGDGGAALAASLNDPHGIAVAPDGTIFFADSGNFRIRKISPAGIITTVAGNGSEGDSGDNGPAVNASLSLVLTVALHAPSSSLYIGDVNNNRVRRLDLATGEITNFAGIGFAGIGFAGDGGDAAAASVGFPEGVAVAPDGSVYLADTINCRIRKIGTDNVIQTVAGSNVCAVGGDGGDATAATLFFPRRVTVDASGNVFIADGDNSVRRIAAGTNVISTVAASSLDGIGDIVTDALGDLYVGTLTQVLHVDLPSGTTSAFAGTGVSGFSGDGGPATTALFNDINGLAFTPAGALLLSDSGNSRIRSVSPDPFDLAIDLGTTQEFLDLLTGIEGGVLMVNVDGRTLLIIPNLLSVGLDVTITGSDQLLVVDLDALHRVGGNIDISGNLAMTSLDLSSLVTVGGSLNIAGDPSLSAILISGVTSIGGDLTILGSAATVINMASLGTVTGSIDISGNTAAGAIDMGSLVTTTGGVTIDGNTSALVIDMGLTTAVGSLTITDNAAANPIDMASLVTVGGSVDISGNTSVGGLDLGALTDVAGPINMVDNTSVGGLDLSALVSTGSIDITGNDSATTIDMGALTTVSGGVTIVDNGAAAIIMGASTAVSGSVTIETTGTGTFPMGDGAIAGHLALDTTGYTTVSGTTALGTTAVTVETIAAAVMTMQIPAATFVSPVNFSVTRLNPSALSPESGTGPDGQPAVVDPMEAFQFSFAVPTLNQDATLRFDIHVAALSAVEQADLLAALVGGRASLAVQGDAPGAPYQTFPVCAPVEPLVAGGCVRVEQFDASGAPLPPGSTEAPAVVRFTGVVGHFSTYAVVLAGAPGDSDFDGDIDLLDFARLGACLAGPHGGLQAANCARFDLHPDADVDLEDFASFQRTFTSE